jgi:hypothetical protein
MNSLLIHGVYDAKTLGTLKDKGIKEISFDLRGRSPNLIPFSQLQELLKTVALQDIFLTFGTDKKETIKSFLNLLNGNFKLIFRDNQSADFYQSIGAPFFWMYSPEGDWKSILSVSNCLGVILPLKYELEYKKIPAMWSLIEEKNLDVYLHAETFEQTILIKNAGDVKLSIDLTTEVETSYRTVDQNKLAGFKIWSRFNENSSLQR